MVILLLQTPNVIGKLLAFGEVNVDILDGHDWWFAANLRENSE